VGRLVQPNKPDRLTLDEVFKTLSVLDTDVRFEAHRPENVWYGVTYDFQKNKDGRHDVTSGPLAVDLLDVPYSRADEAERSEAGKGNHLQDVRLKGYGARSVEEKMIKVQRELKVKLSSIGINLPLPRQ